MGRPAGWMQKLTGRSTMRSPGAPTRKQIEHDRQMKPAGASSDIRDIGGVGHVRCHWIEPTTQHIGGYRQGMFAVGCVNEFTLPDGFQLSLPHQPPHFMAADSQPVVGQGGHDPAAAIALMACRESGPHMHAGLALGGLGGTSPGLVKTRTAHSQHPAALGNAEGLLLQLVDESVTHFSSRAKKADAFFNISTSPRN